jgi:hypothetical protein
MDIETFLLWFSWISLVFWSGVLIWCVASIVIRQRQEKKWLETYVPTLKSDIREPEIQSWLTLTTLTDFRKEQEAAKHAPVKKKKHPSGFEEEE